jgi:hypothetical protein
MDSNIVIAIAGIGGTLLAAVIGAVGTYFFQKRAAERQRKWALEDEGREKEHERETEQRRIKRELLCKRLDILEESIKLMMLCVSRAFDEYVGEPHVDNTDTLQKKMKRLQNIRGEAWAALIAINSENLTNLWKVISSAYWEAEENGTVILESWQKASDAYPAIIKLTDEMRSEI